MLVWQGDVNVVPHEDKRGFRKRLRRQRASFAAQAVKDASRAIAERVAAIEAVADARRIFTYVSIDGEVSTHDLIRRWLTDGKQVAVPRIIGDGVMQAVRIGGLDALSPDRYGIPSPPADGPQMRRPDVVIVPGLAFTRSGTRLGQAGGYYDRYLAAHPDATAVGLCFAWQVVDDLPAEPHDEKVDWVVTEDEALRVE